MVITYEKLKAKAVLELQKRLRGQTSFGVNQKGYSLEYMIDVLPVIVDNPSLKNKREACREVLAEFEDEAIKIIKRWDIRKVAKLITLFPSIIPQKYKNCKIEIFVRDSDSEWIVAFC